MNRPWTILHRIRSLAPWLTVATLCALASALPNRVSIDGEGSDRLAEIATTFEDVPYFVGEWIGRDAPVPQEAQKLLRPNAILSRTYQNSDGIYVHLVVVHCSDARDMIGHYPPICYPSSGFVAVEANHDEPIEMRAGDARIPAALYAFKRTREYGEAEEIRIFNTFVLPGGTVTPDIRNVHRQSERLAVSVQGVAQLQVITTLSVPAEKAVAAANELLAGIPDLMRVLDLAQTSSQSDAIGDHGQRSDA